MTYSPDTGNTHVSQGVRGQLDDLRVAGMTRCSEGLRLKTCVLLFINLIKNYKYYGALLLWTIIKLSAS